LKKLRIKAKIALTMLGAAFISVSFATAIIIQALALEGEGAGGIVITAIILAAVLPVYCVIVGVLLSGNISKPLHFLAECISSIADTGNIFLDDYAYKQTKVLNTRGDDIGNISRSVGDMLAMFREKIRWLNSVKDGDLTVNMVGRSPKDTVGMAMISMVDSLNSMFRDIQSASNLVTEGSFRMDGGAKLLAEYSGEQADSLDRIETTIRDVALHAEQKAGMASQAALLSKNVKALAEKGGSQMTEMMNAVNQINASSTAIGKVIKVIEEIAFQTNILALNAGVEAARAGQNGKGFAVVASEIRALAAKSSSAAHETGDLINDSMEKAKLGSRIAEETAVSLMEIVKSITESADLANQISALSDEQASVISDINHNITRINEAVHQSSRTADDSAADSREVSEQSALLREFIEKFKIRS